MKRFAAALTALVLALCLSPCAYALVTLEKPDEAQMVYLPADDYESYRADFYLSALTAIERDGDDLRLLFPSSRIVLRGFFATNDTRRALRFAGGESIQLDFEADTDGSVRCTRQTLTDVDGLTAVNLRPETVYVADGCTLIPVSAGRAAVNFTNALGDSLQRLSIRVTDAGGALTVECLCPECNEDQGTALHMRACGHYTCSPGFDAAAHSVPECGIAGHCTVDGAAHGKCRNCQKPLCNGEDHGVGVCQHEHMWVQKSYTAATATTDGYSVAECVTCGTVYEQIFPATGG